jgi:hypothetical protein
VKTIIAPELIAVEGLQEWSQARQLLRGCNSHTNGGLDMVHAFYVGMLALRYRTEEGEKIIWPNQFRWLLEQRLLLWENHDSWGMSKEVIRDKSNANTTVKLFALSQVSWFVAQSIMRTAHDLPLSQLETMTLSYVPLFAVAYFFWWTKPKDVLTPSVIDLPEMSRDQQEFFEHLSIDPGFDGEDTEKKISLLTVWKLTPRVFEKEAKDKAAEDISRQQSFGATRDAESMISFEGKVDNIASMRKGSIESKSREMPVQALHVDGVEAIPSPTKVRHSVTVDCCERSIPEPPTRRAKTIQIIEEISDVRHETPSFVGRVARRATTGFLSADSDADISRPRKKDRVLPLHQEEIVLGYWDPHIYHSRIWPLTCLFGASFGALHLISWHTVFPTLVESWLWRAAAVTSIVSMLIFMQYEKVVLKWGGPLVLLSIASPAIYLLSRIVMIAGVIAAFRAMDPRVYDVYVVSTYWVHLA